MRFARDRDRYREWLRQGVIRHRVPIYGYCITSNHVHLIAHADNVEAVGNLMHLAAGSTAKQFNLRKERTGAMWQHPYQCTIIEDGRHLLNCLCYVDLNMVRAGVVSHPSEWRWSGHDELTKSRKRYGLLNIDRLLQSLDIVDIKTFKDVYDAAIQNRLEQRQFQRESYWTEALAVGSKRFVEKAQSRYARRWSFDVQQIGEGADQPWAVREFQEPYTPISHPKTAGKTLN